MKNKKNISDKEIEKVIKSGETMSTCAVILGMSFISFKRRADKLGLYKPNQGRIGIKRDSREYIKITIPLEDIISGKFKGHYGSSKLRKRLIKDGYKENKCEICKINNWNGKDITLELHHIDGNRGNNRIENLSILCPNCHSQTPNHSKRIRKSIIAEAKKEEREKKRVERNKKSIISEIKKEKAEIKKKEKELKQKEIINEKISFIINSGIDFSKFGWVNSVSDILKIKPQKVKGWMEKNMAEFYKSCYKRKPRKIDI
jgi:hypothetical protein